MQILRSFLRCKYAIDRLYFAHRVLSSMHLSQIYYTWNWLCARNSSAWNCIDGNSPHKSPFAVENWDNKMWIHRLSRLKFNTKHVWNIYDYMFLQKLLQLKVKFDGIIFFCSLHCCVIVKRFVLHAYLLNHWVWTWRFREILKLRTKSNTVVNPVTRFCIWSLLK